MTTDASPKWIGDQPRTSWAYWVRMNGTPKAVVPSAKSTRLPPTSARDRNIRSGASGAADRDSTPAKTAISTAASASRPSVWPSAHPASGASTTAYTSATSAAVIVTAPATSKRRCRTTARLSRRSTGLSAATRRPTGTLMKKIHSQPRPSVTGPPISHAAVPPMAPVEPQIPSALLRSAPSGNVVMRIDRAVGVMIAAATPCTARALSSASVVPASPAPSEASANRPVRR